MAYGLLLSHNAAVGYVNGALVTHLVQEVLFLAMAAGVIECTITFCATAL